MRCVMFVGWEGVGLASYLLIGFYFKKDSAANAGKKAFIVNRIGDFGFLIGMFLLLANFGTLTFSEIATKLGQDPGWQGGVVTVIALCLLLGATGKSAQLPLYIWLPDAMEGPTPVSALIHAATMVTAGVYMIARTHVLFDHSPFALGVVAIVGAATALFAATIGLVQNDIKRVLAYSTISQLGYMFLGCGVAAYSAAIFHLMTHAFFKALLFLAAGSVIHAMGGEQDMRKMGGLRKKLPVTFWTMTAAVFAIAGFPPLAAFFSKDAILYSAYLHGTGGMVLWFVGLVTALLTALYMFRLWYMTFMGEARSPEIHAHESPWSMLGPLVILALLSIGGGWIGMERFAAFLAPATGSRIAESSYAESGVDSERRCGGCGAFGMADCGPALSAEACAGGAIGCGGSGRLQTAGQQILRGRDLWRDGGEAAAGLFTIRAGMGGRRWAAWRAGLAAGRDCDVCGRDLAAVAIGQSAFVCGVAGGGRGRGAAVHDCSDVAFGAGRNHFKPALDRDTENGRDQPIDSHADPAGSAGRGGAGGAGARPLQVAELDCAAYCAGDFRTDAASACAFCCGTGWVPV